MVYQYDKGVPMHGLQIKQLQFKNFMSVGNVLQSILFENGNLRIITGEDTDSPTLKRSGIGKAQPLYSKVKVKNGWKPIGKIGVGDTVVTPKGTETIVTGVYPQGKKSVNKIKFADGRIVNACDEHLWKVFTGDKQWHVVNTNAIKSYLENDVNVFIPVIEDSCDDDHTYPFDPYLMMLCIISGEINDGGYVTLNTYDDEVEGNVSMIVDGMEGVSSITTNDGITLIDENNQLSEIVEDISCIENLIDYVTELGSYTQHRKFMQAILDVHGYESDKGELQCVFSEKQKNLAILTQKLAWTLGGVAYIKKNIASDELFNIQEEYVLTLRFKNPNHFFSSMLKKTFGTTGSLMLKVSSITQKEEKEPCVCISVLSNEKLYVTDNYVVTHNTTIPNAIAYAFYGKAVADIRPKRLPNKTNEKGMFVRIDYEKDGKKYFIERGVKPDIFRFVEVQGDKEIEKNETQGTKSDTQTEIERTVGMSHELFTMIVTVNTIKDCFMKKTLAKQRDIIEEILNISELTRKAKILSEIKIKESKIEIEKEKVRIESQVTMKKRAEEQLNNAKRQYQRWDQDHNNLLIDLYKKLESYLAIDIDEEIRKHDENQLIKEDNQKRTQVLSEKRSTEQLMNQGVRRLTEINTMLESFTANVCPTCKQSIDDEKHKAEEDKLRTEANEYFVVLEDVEVKIKDFDSQLTNLEEKPLNSTSYRNIQDAYNHQSSLNNVKERIEQVEKETNPHQETIDNAEKMLDDSKVNYKTLEGLEKRLSHQLFLQKMLTGRDSFIRKRIIDISLPVLNKNIEKYLRKTNIRHDMKFQSDLTLEIYKAGNEYDFDQLSRGEQNWAIISLNLAMRELFEELCGDVNLLFVDELIDFGIDLGQATDAFEILKELSRDSNKSVALITHREELFEKADEILYTIMENEFTRYEQRIN